MGPAKFFRKYSRVLVLVFMSALLVVFLIEPVLQYNRGPATGAIALGEAFGRKITDGDLERVQSDLLIADMLGFETSMFRIGGDARVNAFLLTEEARRMGVRIGRDYARNLLTQQGVSDAALDQVRQRTRRSLDSIYEAIANYVTVVHAAQNVAMGVPESLPRVEVMYRDQFQEADVRVSLLDVRAFLDAVPQPTEQELQEFYETAKNRNTAHKRDELVFGYRMTHRAKIEYATVKPEKLEDTVFASRRDAENWFEARKAFYLRSLTSQPAGEPTYEALPQAMQDRVRDDCRQAKLGAEATKLINEVFDYTVRPWRDQPRDEQGFRLPPPADQVITLAATQAHFAGRVPVDVETTDLIELRMFTEIPGFGAARYAAGRDTMNAWALAWRSKGFVDPDPNDTRPLLAVGEPSPVLIESRRDPAIANSLQPRQGYFFRVLETLPEGPPRSLDEVRERVVSEWRLMKAFELAGAAARQLAEQARGVGLEAAVAGATDLLARLEAAEPQREAGRVSRTWPAVLPKPYKEALGPFTPEGGFTRRTTVLYTFNTPVEHLPEEVFKLAEQPASDTQPGHRVGLVPAAQSFKWVVVELRSVQPIYRGDFDQLRERVLASLQQREEKEVLQAWFNPVNVRLRAGYKDLMAAQ